MTRDGRVGRFVLKVNVCNDFQGLAKLANDSMVESVLKYPQHFSDSRAKTEFALGLLRITKTAEQKYKTVMRMNRGRQRQLLNQLDSTERRVMFEATGRLIEHVRGEI